MAYALFPTTVKADWKMREGGVLYTLGEYGDFFNSMMGYHNPAKRTDIAEWDTLFEKLENSGYRKNIIPCMVSYFRLVNGCWASGSHKCAVVFRPKGWVPGSKLSVPA